MAFARFCFCKNNKRMIIITGTRSANLQETDAGTAGEAQHTRHRSIYAQHSQELDCTDPRTETRPRDPQCIHPAPQCPPTRTCAQEIPHEMRARGATPQCAADGQGLRGAPLALGDLPPAASPVRSVTSSSSSLAGRGTNSPMMHAQDVWIVGRRFFSFLVF